MKYYIRHFLIALLIVAGSTIAVRAQSNHPDSLTVEKAIGLALKNQPALEELEADVNAAEARIGEAEQGKYPQIDLEGSFSHQDPVPEFQLDPSEPAAGLEPKNLYNAHIAAHQIIYDFGKTKANIALARSRTLTAKQQIEVKKWVISYFTVQTYYGILYVQRQVDVQNQQISTLKEDRDLAQKRLDNGSATKYDVLSIKVRIAEERNNKLDLQNREQKMKIQLRKLFGWQPDQSVKLAGSLTNSQKAPAIRPGEINYANRPDFQVLQKRKEAAKQAYALDGLVNRPTISAGGMAGYRNGYIQDLNKLYANYSVSVNVKVPLFSGFETRYKKQEAHAELQSVKAQTSQLQRTISSEVQQAYADVETAIQKLQTADLQIEQAQEQLRLAKLRYRKGVVTNTDLLTSETALARARLQKLTAQYHILLNQYELKKAAGRRIW